MPDKVDYWLDLADDDVSVAEMLLNGKKYLYAGFFCHLIVEKAIKAIVANVTSEAPPKIHRLKKLALAGKIFDILSEDQLELLDELDPLNIEGRYPEYKTNIEMKLNHEYCTELLKRVEDFLCWTKQWLGK